MNYINQIDINLPRARVVELFDNTENLKEWMPGLVLFETFEGQPGKPGAKSRMEFQMGKRKIKMIETIVSNNLPDEMEGYYEMNGVKNNIKASFVEIEPNKTMYISESTFKLSGVMWLIGPLMKKTFMKTSQDYLERFKLFAEGRGMK